jgi:hypothetical protein
MNISKRWVAVNGLMTVLSASLVLSSCVPIVGGTAVGVQLDEFTVTPDAQSAPAGRITFRVSNVGEEFHEFLVIKTDLAEDDLPTEADGSYEENGAGTELLDEIEGIPPGGSRNLTLDLDAGSYVLICNIVEAEGGETEAHYSLGMHAAFTVE